MEKKIDVKCTNIALTKGPSTVQFAGEKIVIAIQYDQPGEAKAFDIDETYSFTVKKSTDGK